MFPAGVSCGPGLGIGSSDGIAANSPSHLKATAEVWVWLEALEKAFMLCRLNKQNYGRLWHVSASRPFSVLPSRFKQAQKRNIFPTLFTPVPFHPSSQVLFLSALPPCPPALPPAFPFKFCCGSLVSLLYTDIYIYICVYVCMFLLGRAL